MRKAKFILFFLVPLFVGINARSQNNRGKVDFNINGSAAVANFIDTSTTCYKLEFVERNAGLFVAGKGYSILILKNISAETKRPMFMAVNNGGVKLTDENKIVLLQEQIREIREMVKCAE